MVSSSGGGQSRLPLPKRWYKLGQNLRRINLIFCQQYFFSVLNTRGQGYLFGQGNRIGPQARLLPILVLVFNMKKNIAGKKFKISLAISLAIGQSN